MPSRIVFPDVENCSRLEPLGKRDRDDHREDHQDKGFHRRRSFAYASIPFPLEIFSARAHVLRTPQRFLRRVSVFLDLVALVRVAADLVQRFIDDTTLHLGLEVIHLLAPTNSIDATRVRERFVALHVLAAGLKNLLCDR